MIRICILWLLLLLSFSAFCQKYATVIAPSGLSVREAPNLSAKRLGKFAFNEQLELLETSEKTLTIEDQGQKIVGNWLKVKNEANLVGYAFGGYLLLQERKRDRGFGCEEERPCDSKITFQAMDMLIYDYQTENPAYTPSKKDTAVRHEYVFNDLGGKLVQIIPKQEADSIEVFFTANELIQEQFKREWLKQDNFSWEKWEAERLRWEGYLPYQKLRGKNGFYHIPSLNYQATEKRRKEMMGLRDTLVVEPGESDDVATLVYQETVCNYTIDKVFVKLILHHGAVKITKYVEVTLSYGC